MKAKHDEHGIPVPDIELSGFPTCKVASEHEVNPGEQFCAMHGGTVLSVEGQRRTIHRTIRVGIMRMMRCRQCQGLPLKDLRCSACAWTRGVAMGVAGFAEVMGWSDELMPYMEMISHFDPGWQRKVTL